MTRTLLAIAAAFFAATTFLAPAAEACISCEYVPPVVNTPVYSHGASHYKRSRVRAAVKVRRTRPAQQIVETKSAPKKIESAKADPVELDVKSENSTISTASIEKSEAVEAKAAPAEEKAKVSTNVGCKKFFPTVGMTLTVPCE